ncbi:MAG: hypothetical protein H7326_11930 [Bdellovibrionaceae bacterium]|nr:hypothetical protein [Pseudobdellovibrionaceae bacterium]
MILEFIEYLRTRSSKLAKEWGYAYQTVSLKYRSRRCAGAWQSHLEQSHKLIREQFQKIKPKSIMIIGSGLLIEIPIQDLIKSGVKIYLVDIVHAKEVRRLAKLYPQIELIEKDISSLLEILKKGMAPFQLKTIPWGTLTPWDLPKSDWVISANLLSQIPLMISESLPMSTEVYDEFARKVRDQHIERSLQLSDKVLLFADFETRYIGHDGKRIKTEAYEVNLRDLKYIRDWTWEISPFGETSKDYKIEMLVKAYWKF